MIRSTILATAFALTIAALLALDASAKPKAYLVGGNVAPAIQPPVGQPVFLPKFGFQSYNINGYGERVTHINCHGIARELGLEPGDTILTLNGMPLTYHGAWNQALTQAMYQGGSVTLAIRDVHSGAVVYRSKFFGGGGGIGPITPKSAPFNPPTQKFSQPQPQVGFPGPSPSKFAKSNNHLSVHKGLKVNAQSIKQFGQLLKMGE
ncbi:PDZ domain-containing protein [Aeoliella sp. ICT_H6.2]|uniref:PDZ domain-containing protein n=1 Tax=Aeoliella straminimaris TaxID=2954799 RepID=A0A9X2JGX2_9BACT|nr:PDZ domain-containing protein [Aeoliella straminimaris]MCO6044023.1 PDZ domain-containing protein [Aeoliella straminimaris]